METTTTEFEKYLAIAPNYWGRGDDLVDAMTNLLDQDSEARECYYVLKFVADHDFFVFVDDFGHIIASPVSPDGEEHDPPVATVVYVKNVPGMKEGDTL